MNRKAHNLITSHALPDVSEEVIDGCNRILDAASKDLGPRHRVINHDMLSATRACAGVATRLGSLPEDGARAAIAHLMEDAISDRMVAIRVAPGLSAKNIFDFITERWPS